MKKGHKPDFLAIANIGKALCGQILVANYTGKRRIVYEYFFRHTVVEVAHARGFSIVPEYRLNRTKERGSRKKIDYCLIYNNQKIALELKVIKDINHNYNLKNDIVKLNKFLTDEDKQLNLSAYHMIVTYSNQKNKSIDFKGEVERIKKNLDTYHAIKEVVFLDDRDLRYSRKATKNTLYISKATIDSSTAVCGFVKIA